jgi:nicotinamide-nucleotide amidase
MHADTLCQLAQTLGQQWLKKKQRIVTAESCTGGSLSALITAIPGSSQWFDRGFVTYSNQAKTEMLGVAAQLIASHGAVSEAVARAMALGALQHSHAQVSIAITGIAGPGGGSFEKPVGTVWIAWAQSADLVTAQCCLFQGSRQTIREQAVERALTFFGK